MLLHWKLQWILIFQYNCMFPYFGKCLASPWILAKSTLHCIWQIQSIRKTLSYYRFLTYFQCSLYRFYRFLLQSDRDHFTYSKSQCLARGILRMLYGFVQQAMFPEYVEISPKRKLSSTCSMTTGVMKWCYQKNL